jgi:hypothetical protein
MARFGFAFFDSGVRFDQPDAHPTTMRTLASFLQNPFDDPNISMNELIAFTTDHLQRMSANNAGGELSTRIAATTSSLATVEDCVTDDQGRLGLRKARKQAKDDFRLQIPVDVKRIEAGFIAAFGADSPVLLEALPQGRTIFQTCRDDQVEVHLQTLLDAATTHQASLAPATLTQATTLKNNWVTIYQASEASTGSKTVTQEGKKLARENLQLMLFLNLLKLAEMFPRQPEKLALYMMQHLLENPSAPDEPTPPVPPTP